MNLSSSNFIDKHHYQLIFDHSPILIAHVSSDNCYKIVNKKYCEWVGKSCDEIIGSNIVDVISEEAFKLAKPKIELVLQGQEVHFEAKVPHSSGQLKWVNATYVPELDVNGKVIKFCAFIIDINDRKEEEFKHQNLMRAIEKGIEGFIKACWCNFDHSDS